MGGVRGRPDAVIVRRTDSRSSDVNGDCGTLRRLLEDTIEIHGGRLKDWTVLAEDNDPFRRDTPANHRDARWLLATQAEVKLPNAREIHLRGLHYALIGVPKPNGQL
jgi:hypothetical protein